MKRCISFFNLFFMLLFMTITTGCFKDGENSVTQELLRPVSVFISGNVISADTGEAVAGAEVRIQRLLGDNSTSFIKDGASDLIALTDASGNFDFDNAIELEVDTYQHFLHISDSSNTYYTNDSQVVYSIRDAELVYKDVRLMSKKPKTTTIVAGTVKNVLQDAAVAGASIRLTHATDSSIIHTATTATDGTFAIESVSVSEYILRVDGSTLSPTTFVVEDSTVKLTGDATNNLGNIRIAPTINAEDLRIVLQWNQSAGMDLDIQYTFPKPDLDFNHCGVKTIDMGASDFSVNSAYSFAEGTSYWPENMGGEGRLAISNRDEPGRYTLDKDAGTIYTDTYWPGTENKYIVGGETIAELDRNSTDGSTPEVLTIHKKNFLKTFPANLSYYYNYVKDSVVKQFYPAALGVFTVRNADTGNTSIYKSGAVVKIYKGNSYLGKFSVSDLEISAGESNKKYWTVLLIEQGYTKASPSSVNDIYFRVVPYGSQPATLEVTPMKFYFNVEGIPSDKTITAYDDLTTKIEYASLSSKHMRAAGTEDGYVYTMSQSHAAAATVDYKWRNSWYGHFPGCKVTSIHCNPQGYGVFAFLNKVPDSAPWIGSQSKTSDYNYTVWNSTNTSETTTLSSDGSYYLPVDWSTVGSAGGPGVYDFAAYYEKNDGGGYANIAATANGPRREFGLSNPWSGSAVVPQIPADLPIVKICPIVPYKGGLFEGRVLCAGTNKLWLYNSNYAYDSADAWTDVRDSDGNLVPNVKAMAAITSNYDAYWDNTLSMGFYNEAFIVKYDTVLDKYVIGKAYYNTVTSRYIVRFNEGFWNGNKINDIKIVKFGYTTYVFFATDNGVFYRDKKYIDYFDLDYTDPSDGGKYTYAKYPAVKLSPLLDGISVLKIVDYDGKIGLLTRDNGIIVGPYPEWSW